MPTTWIVVADAAVAYIYALRKQEFQLIKTFEHEASRLKRDELVRDTPGVHGPTGRMAQTFVGRSDPKEVEKESFALTIVDYLEKHKSSAHFDNIIWISQAHFYGMAKKHMSMPLQKLVTQHIDKNYVQWNDKELRQWILDNRILENAMTIKIETKT